MEDEALRRQAKTELRFRLRQLRRALPAEARQRRSESATQRLIALPEFERARHVLLFAAMRAEIGTQGLEAACRALGKSVSCPRMTEDGSDLDPRLWEPGVVPFEQGRMAPEPPPDAPAVAFESVDLVVCPGVAFDLRGARLGYGKGMYDRLLPKLRRAVRVGYAFDFQLLAEIPETSGDERVHCIVTDAQLVRCG